MNNESSQSFAGSNFYKKLKKSLKLTPVVGLAEFKRRLNLYGLKKCSLGVKVWGKKEMTRLEALSTEEKERFLRRRMKKEVLCLIVADNLSFLKEIKDEAKKRAISLFLSPLPQKKCRQELDGLIRKFSLQTCLISGGLLQIFGLGVLIIGDSGIGKSESALELISRGHLFVSDDVVSIKVVENKLFGEAPPLSRYFMEIRGLGIINIREIFGPKAVLEHTEINLVIHLKKWERGKEYDRLGLEFSENYKVLEYNLPQISIPVAPGRNIATLIEVACKVHILREKGYLASREIDKKLRRALSTP